MCSIEEAWAGQTFAGKPVSSQADIHNAYMHIPDDLLTRNNEFSVSNPNEPQSRNGTRGINSKYSRQPRVPNMSRNSDNANINISSVMPPLDNYGGINPRPAYMSIYDKSNNNDPMPMMLSKDNFNNLENAFKVSDTVNRFMNIDNTNKNFNDLQLEDTEEDRQMINTKFNKNRSNNSNTSNNSNNFTDTSSTTDNSISNMQFQMILQSILMKLDKLESDLNHNQSRNMYDISLYILIGMIISFMLYTIISNMKK
jgi:hypothetical protein